MSRPGVIAAGPGRAEEISSLQSACFANAWGMTGVANAIALPGVAAFLARDAPPEGHGRLSVGFALVQAVRDEAEILSFGVLPAWRRRGHGARLLARCLAHLVAVGARVVFLEVAADNAAAIALYRAAGFAAVGRRPGYYAAPSGPADAVVMRLDLPTGGAGVERPGATAPPLRK